MVIGLINRNRIRRRIKRSVSKDKKVRVSSLLSSDNNVIMLEEDEAIDFSVIAGGVVTVLPNYDDVYGHRTYKPKSHMEKNKKKCK